MSDRTDHRTGVTDEHGDEVGAPGDAPAETVYEPTGDGDGDDVYVATPDADTDAHTDAADSDIDDDVDVEQPPGNGDGGPGDDFAAWFDREFTVPAVAATTVVEPDEAEIIGDDDLQGEPDELIPAPAAPPPEDAAPWYERAGRRVIRRPAGWLERPWPVDRVVRVTVTMLTLVITTVVMMNVVHLNPLNPRADLIFDDNTPTGGDMGAHVWGPAYLRDVLLPHFQLNGWSMDWYGGMPAYRFYMVLPALAMVAADVVLPYGEAFKLVAVSGLITLPLACWAFGRLARFRYPMPELFAVAGLCFALDESFSIYGGNVKSTMAGEFSFSIALTLGILGLGVLANGMRTGRFRSWAAILLAAGAVCHGIVMIFLALASVVIFLVWVDSRKRLRYGLTAGIAAALLVMWWLGPFVLNHAYMTDMKYGARPEGATDSFWDMFFPLEAPLDVLISVLAVVGFGACLARRHRTGTALGVTTLLLVALVYLTQDSLPVIGLLWNPRLLPFIYFLRYMLMMVGIVEIGTMIANVARDRPARAATGGIVSSTISFGVAALSVLLVLGFMFEVLPGGGRRQEHDTVVYAWGPLRKTATAGDALADSWASYNFNGYESRPRYAEYHDIVQTMSTLGDTRGCGRATWENNEENGSYGTTMALMLLPHWTDGCIGSMEGLFFEASGTTPYHFLATAAISANSSNPVRELRYVNNDAAVGVPELRALGVRYLMVRTPEAKTEAAAQPDLLRVAASGPWDVYEVQDSEIVVPLTVQPVVVNGRSGDQRERNLELGTSWFQQPEEWAAMPADDGPDDWQRIDVAVDQTRVVPDPNRPADDPDTRGKQVDIVVPADTIEPVELPPVEVSDVVVDEQAVSFRVDQVGVPVLVKVSYFPNWRVDGADGPYRVAPNMMVVVPTDTEVRLHYGRSGADTASYLLTLAGIVMLIVMRIRGDVRYDEPAMEGAEGSGGSDDESDDEFDDAGDDGGDDGGAGPPPPPPPGAVPVMSASVDDDPG